MGSRIQRSVPLDIENKKRRAAATEDAEGSQKRKRDPNNFGYSDIIEATQFVEGIVYRPRTTETREVYELFLSTIHRVLGDQAQDIIRSAADTVLQILKTDSMKDFDKKKDIESVLLGPISGEMFPQLVSLSKKITDYPTDEAAAVDPDADFKDVQIDDDVGVAVVFEDEEDPENDERSRE